MSSYPESLTLRGEAIRDLSNDDFFDICQANELLHIEREPGGELLLRPLAGWAVSQLNGAVLHQLTGWRRAHGGHVLGWASFQLPDGSVRSPAAAWVSVAAHARLTPAQRKKFPPICPELVVEFKVDSDRLETCQQRMAHWLANGVQLGFLLTDDPETAYVYRSGQPVEILQSFGRELSGEPLLPGFRLDLRELREAAA